MINGFGHSNDRHAAISLGTIINLIELIESIPNGAGAIRFEGFIPQGINAESSKFHLRNGRTQRLGRQSDYISIAACHSGDLVSLSITDRVGKTSSIQQFNSRAFQHPKTTQPGYRELPSPHQPSDSDFFKSSLSVGFLYPHQLKVM